MSLFSYEAVDARGRSSRGEIEAESERAARKQLKGRGLILRRLESASEQSRRQPAAARARRLGGDETATFLQQLATLIGAGMPLVEALGSIADGMERPASRSLVNTLRQQVLEGGALAEALRSQGFDEVVCNMVAAGEETGQLEAVAVRLAELLEHRQRLKQELLSAILYPAIVMGFGLIVMLFLLTFVIPQVVTVFDRAGGDLPWITKAVIALSDFFRSFGLWLLGGMALAIFLYRRALQRPEFKWRNDNWLLSLPFLSRLLAKVETARYAHTLGMLLGGGVAALPAMQIASESVGLLPIKAATVQARESLREGGSLAESLRASGHLPHLAVRLIAVGEQSGQLDTMLLRIAESFEGEVARQLKRFVTILEPLLVLLMALMVAALAMAILLPIIQMNELIR